LGAAGTELAPELRHTDPAVMATAAGVAVVNAVGEELLWRGLFVAAFPEDPVWGWLWPAAGFTAWHLAPQAVLPSRPGEGGLSGLQRPDRDGLGWRGGRGRCAGRRLPTWRPTPAGCG
jgi:Type II CAAX prenyl endopeptidase Rce1-like